MPNRAWRREEAHRADETLVKINSLADELRLLRAGFTGSEQGYDYADRHTAAWKLEQALSAAWEQRRRERGTPQEQCFQKPERACDRALRKKRQLHIDSSDWVKLIIDEDEQRGLRRMVHEQPDTSHGSRKVM